MPEHDPLSERILGCAYQVSNALGTGFLEKVYENALAMELREAGLRAVQQAGMQVRYKGAVIGQFTADLLVEERTLVELKACRALEDVHIAQCLNYLKASGMSVCLLLNFGQPKIEVRRLRWTHELGPMWGTHDTRG